MVTMANLQPRDWHAQDESAQPGVPAASTSGGMRRLTRTLPLLGGAVFLVIVFGGYAFNWSWTGFRGNTLWEWLQLLVLPVVLSVGGIWFNMQQGQVSRITALQQHQTDLQIADNVQQEAALDAYLDHMTDMLLEKKLRDSDLDSGLREIAHARTLTSVWRVGKYRKGVLLKFLYESRLIQGDHPVLDLREADFSHANLHGCDLRGACLGGANLSHADLGEAHLVGCVLRQAILVGADLRHTDLTDADLSDADLSDADLTGATLTNATLTGARLPAAGLSSADGQRIRADVRLAHPVKAP